MRDPLGDVCSEIIACLLLEAGFPTLFFAPLFLSPVLASVHLHAPHSSFEYMPHGHKKTLPPLVILFGK